MISSVRYNIHMTNNSYCSHHSQNMAFSDVLNSLELGIKPPPDNGQYDKTKKARCRIFFSIIVVIIVLNWCLLLLTKLVVTNKYQTQEVGVSLPDHWYYDRAVLEMPECQKSAENISRSVVQVSHLDRQCDDIQDCVDIVRSMAASANFFIAIGHVFEGLGWDCNVTDSISIKFVGTLDELDYISFYKLLKLGAEYTEVAKNPIIVRDRETCNRFTCPVK